MAVEGFGDFNINYHIPEPDQNHPPQSSLSHLVTAVGRSLHMGYAYIMQDVHSDSPFSEDFRVENRLRGVDCFGCDPYGPHISVLFRSLHNPSLVYPASIYVTDVGRYLYRMTH